MQIGLIQEVARIEALFEVAERIADEVKLRAPVSVRLQIVYQTQFAGGFPKTRQAVGRYGTRHRRCGRGTARLFRKTSAGVEGSLIPEFRHHFLGKQGHRAHGLRVRQQAEIHIRDEILHLVRRLQVADPGHHLVGGAEISGMF